MKERVIALGFFDGVHLGHGALLRRAAEEAALRGCTPAVFTFDRPPKEVVTGVPCPLINSPEDRRDLVRRLYRIQDVLMVPFDREMMTTPWDDFIVRILVGRYHAVHLVAGHDHHFGHRNQGTPELLAQKCAQLGLGCDIIPKVEVAGITVSSTYIRRLVELGQISRANRFLGHPHTLTGTVRHGRGIGPPNCSPLPTSSFRLMCWCPATGYTPPGPHWRTAPATPLSPTWAPAPRFKTARTSQWRPVSWTSRGTCTVNSCGWSFMSICARRCASTPWTPCGPRSSRMQTPPGPISQTGSPPSLPFDPP